MKSIYIKAIAVAVCLLSVEVSNAQFIVKTKKIQKANLKSEVIYIQTKQLSEKQINYLQRSNTLDSVKARYESENDFLVNLISKNWNLSNTHTELSEKEIALKIKNKEDVWYISLDKHTDRFFDRRVHKQVYYYNYSHYELSLYNNKKEIVSIPLVDEQLSELDLTFALNELQNIVEDGNSFKNNRLYAREANSNANSLKGKTLLISDKLTGYSQEYLQQFFVEQIAIVSDDEILKRVQEQNKEYAYLLITINDYLDKPSFNHLIIDCSSNQAILAYRNSSAVTKPCRHSCISHHHTDKAEYLFGYHLKKYQKLIDS